MADCAHKHMKFDLSAQTSLMNVSFHVFGVHCEDCDRKWDVGELLQAITEMAKLEDMAETDDGLLKECYRMLGLCLSGHWPRPEAEELWTRLHDRYCEAALETQDDNAD